MRKAQYEIISRDEKTIYLNDLSNGEFYRSITNAAEEVCEEVYSKYGNLRIFYYDTVNKDTTTELVHENGVFKKFSFPEEWWKK